MHLIILHGVYHVFDRCRKSVKPQGNPLNWKRTCLPHEDDVGKSGFWWYEGYVFWNTCPKNWTEMSVRQKCKDVNPSDLLNNLPVFDKDSHVTYRNIFCARCNGAVNTTYWMLRFNCSKWFNATAFNFNMNVLNSQCTVRKIPGSFELKYLKRCIPRFHDCLDGSQGKTESYCQTECLRYAFPICVERGFLNFRRFKNPQCAQCNGIKPWLIDECTVSLGQRELFLTILFDFSSTSKYSIKVYDQRLNLQQTTKHVWSCALNEVFDPFTGKCKTIVPAGSQNGYKQSPSVQGNTRNETELSQSCFCEPFNQSEYEQLPNGTVHIKPHNKIYSNISYAIRNDKLLLCVNFSANATTMGCEQSIVKKNTTPASLETELSQNCLFIPFNQSDYEQLPNGSVYIKPHNKIYSNTSYSIRNNKLLLCVNFSRNATATVSVQSIAKTKTTAAYASLQILTFIGCIVSMVSLVLLLITYMLFAELRNLPGKVIINLALSLLAYQAMFFSAVETPLANQEQCLVIAVLLHFLVLSSFTWMNVMAYDVHRTFTTSGKLNPTICICYIYILLLRIRKMEFLVVLLLKGPSRMSFNRVMNDYVKVPMSGFAGNSLDLTSPPAFYLQEREESI